MFNFVPIDTGLVVAIKPQGGWAFAISRTGKHQWSVYAVDKFGNKGRCVGHYELLEQAKAAINE